jgi:hypothetical protein
LSGSAGGSRSQPGRRLSPWLPAASDGYATHTVAEVGQ